MWTRLERKINDEIMKNLITDFQQQAVDQFDYVRSTLWHFCVEKCLAYNF